ncbi:MAG: ATP-dependent helicase HrpB [Pseudomonadota bacterium]
MTSFGLPIDAALPSLLAALSSAGRAVLQAPPGAGKTTCVPLAIFRAGVEGRIIVLEPRRLAARAAAVRMADMLGERPGATVGYRMRGETRTGPDTRIEVVTEGILTRMLQSDPDLPGVGTVIFDEFHERSLQADLGLALTWEARGALRPDLKIVVMSATLDAAPVSELLDNAPLVTSEGQAYPVDTRWLDTPPPRGRQFLDHAAKVVAEAARSADGGILVFLPGAAEIRRMAAALDGRLPGDFTVHALYGSLDLAAQRKAVAPARQGRKLVLATAIAETSLTIEDVRVVVDCGLARRARMDPASGMSRLVTEPVSRAEADQRRGRAGRVAPGTCYRLWTRGGEGALPAFPPAEIEIGDLTGLALELAQWGATPADLAFLTPPPQAALSEAQSLLAGLGALDSNGRITEHGREIAAQPLHPRLAHMLVKAGADAALLAALLAERDPLIGAQSDLGLRLRALSDPATAPAAARGALARISREAARLSKGLTSRASRLSPGEMAALAYPDRIGLRRKGDTPRYLLSGGKGAYLADDDPLASSRWLVATDLDGDPREARIRQAASLTESEVRGLFGDRIETRHVCRWSRRDRRVEARIQECLDALVITDRVWRNVPPEQVQAAALDGLRLLGLDALKPSPSFDRLRARISLARRALPNLPDPSDAALLDVADWILPHLADIRSAADLSNLDPARALEAALPWHLREALDRVAPPSYTTPLGRKVAIDYGAPDPEIAVRLQELFGETVHPQVAGQPLRVTLLSPAGRPVQTTRDLPGFWVGSYADVRKDMRARYPKHPWPEDPTEAEPTLRAKPRR